MKLEGGNVKAKAGTYTIEGSKVDIKADVTAPKAMIDDLQAKRHLKSPNIEDGM